MMIQNTNDEKNKATGTVQSNLYRTFFMCMYSVLNRPASPYDSMRLYNDRTVTAAERSTYKPIYIFGYDEPGTLSSVFASVKPILYHNKDVMSRFGALGTSRCWESPAFIHVRNAMHAPSRTPWPCPPLSPLWPQPTRRTLALD